MVIVVQNDTGNTRVIVRELKVGPLPKEGQGPGWYFRESAPGTEWTGPFTTQAETEHEARLIIGSW